MVLAPISTSSSITTVPPWGVFTQPPGRGSKPKPSDPITAPECTMQRSPIETQGYSTTPGCSSVSLPTRARAPTVTRACRTAPEATTAPGPTMHRGPTAASGATLA